MKIHPLADVFPLLDSDSFRELCDDIKANGLVEPIIVDGDVLIDGRNRLKACEKLGIEPRVRQFATLGVTCGVPAFIWTKNVMRRHLRKDQRAVLVLQFRCAIAEEAKQRQREHGGTAPGRKKTVPMESSEVFREQFETRYQLAKLAGVGTSKIGQAMAVERADPELLPRIARGCLSLQTAIAHIDRPRPNIPRSAPLFDADLRAASIARWLSSELMQRWPLDADLAPLIATLEEVIEDLRVRNKVEELRGTRSPTDALTEKLQ